MSTNRFNRTRWLVASAALLVGLSACSAGGTPDSDAAPDAGEAGGEAGESTEPDSDAPLADLLPDDVREKGTIVWAVEPYYPPFTQSSDDESETVGINIDLAEEMSALLGVTPEVNAGSFDGLIPGIMSERYDVGIATMADTSERREQVDFIDYFQSGTAIFVAPDNPLGVQSMDDLCGHTVGAVKGTFQVDDGEAQAQRCSEEGKEELDLQVFNEQAGMLLALSSGRSDAMLMDYVAGSYAATTEGGGAFEMTGEIADPQRKGMIVSKDRTELRDAVQEAMQELVENGRYLEILEDWDQKDGALETITINDGN